MSASPPRVPEKLIYCGDHKKGSHQQPGDLKNTSKRRIRWADLHTQIVGGDLSRVVAALGGDLGLG
jgi:hypothetical protein